MRRFKDVHVKNGNLLLQVENLKTYFFFREGTLRAVDGVNFDIRRGETLGIAGESGCGKSVTSQSILRIVPKSGRIVDGKILFDPDDKGTVDLVQLKAHGRQMRQIRGAKISMIFQEPMVSFSPVYTIGNQISEVIMLHQNCSRKEAREKTIELLGKVGLPKANQNIDAYPFNLSGGMRQRAMIAMALSCQPSLLIADEPTTAVDVTIQAQVLELIKQLQEDLDMGLIFITHDLAVIAELCDKVLIMYLGKNMEYASVEEIFYNSKHPYTKGLLDSIPKLGKGSRQKIDPIAGSVPSPYNKPSGCPFYPRCPQIIPGLCDKKEPPSIEIKEHHTVSCFLYQK